MAEFKGLDLPEIIKLNEIVCKPVLSEETVKGTIHAVITFFDYAIRMEYTDLNPFKGMKFKKDYRKKNKKTKSWEDEHLYQIFSMEPYNSGKPKKEYQYWIPLLLRYTGARLNELAQLYTDDIVNYCGVWCMEIYPMINGQKVKNKNSARIVPISIHLINHGFIDYVKTKKGHIFHELPLRISGYGDNASKWASRWRTRFGYKRDLTLHSFRNRYVDELKKLNVEERYAAELCGHGHDGFTYSIYGHETDPRKLFEIVNLIDNKFTQNIKSFNGCSNK